MTMEKRAITSKAKKPLAKKNKDAAAKGMPKRKTPKSKAIMSKPEDVVKWEAFQQAKSMGEEYANDPEKAKGLVDAAMEKAERTNKGPIGDVWKYLTALSRFSGNFINRRYTKVSGQTIALAIGGLIYFVNPFDLVPDFIPGLGYIDDAMVVKFIVTSIKADLDNFLIWEQAIKKITRKKPSRSRDPKDFIQ